jgi:hypothetical protein
MKICAALLLWIVGGGFLFATETNSRFSEWLPSAERSALGLARLSSDQVAVLDALVRRNTAAFVNSSAEAPTPGFSQGLTADERRNAGLLLFNTEEIARIDQWVARFASSTRTRALLAPPVYAARPRLVEPREDKDKAERKIHGSFSLSMGWGSGGYSERTGSMVLRQDDPAGRYSITVGYSESVIKNGSAIYRTERP